MVASRNTSNVCIHAALALNGSVISIGLVKLQYLPDLTIYEFESIHDAQVLN